MATVEGGTKAIDYAESRQYTEPLFVFVIMVVAGSRSVLEAIKALVATLARLIPVRTVVAQTWLCLAVVPLVGSLITEPAAMTLAALMLAPLAAPPVLMVASTWNWDGVFMASTFGWKACVAVAVNAAAITYLLSKHLPDASSAPKDAGAAGALPVPPIVSAIHLAFLIAVVAFAHHPVIFFGSFLMFLGFAQAYERYQTQLILKEALLVGFFLAGLVVLGGLQQWWLEPIVSSLTPAALFFGALGLTAITDNAALTYLGSLIEGISDPAKYMLVAGAIAGGGLTVIAIAPNRLTETPAAGP